MTLYSVVTAEQFLNYKDDRQRGVGSNPFGNFKDVTASTKPNSKGAHPGDVDMFKFAVYRNAALNERAGTAVFTCKYGFNKLAFCNASYELSDGILVGAGAVDFSKASFALAITGGSGKYGALRGDMASAPATRHSQRLLFVLG